MNILTLLVIILLSIGFILGIYVTYYYIRNGQQQSDTLSVYFRAVLFSLIPLYLTFIVSLLAMVIISRDEFAEKQTILNTFAFLSYYGLLLNALWTFMGRLHYSYKDTQYQIGKLLLVILWMCMCFIVVLYVFSASMRFLCLLFNKEIICVTMPAVSDGFFMLLYFILSVILVFLFSSKLRKMIINLNQSTTTSQSLKLNNLMQQLRKYILLSFFQLTSTVFVIMLQQLFQGYRTNILMYIYVIIDSMINLICIMLQYQFTTPIYNKYCKICECCLNCCSIKLKKFEQQETHTNEKTTTTDLGLKVEIDQRSSTNIDSTNKLNNKSKSTKDLESDSQRTTTSELEMYAKQNKKTIANLRNNLEKS
eukprot:293570_1